MSLHDFRRLQDRLQAVADPIGFLVNLFAHAPVGFAVWTADGHPLLTNQAFMDLFGVEPPPEYNVLEDELLAENGMLALFKRAFGGETVHVPPFWYDPRDLKTIKVSAGRRVSISMTIFPLFKPNGEIDYVAATYKDETEIRHLNENLERLVQERTTQLKAANRDLEAFSYSVAHDLRSPLRSINGFASILLQEHKDQYGAEGLNYLNKIRENSLLMAQVIDALLALSQLTRSELQPALTDLAALTQIVVNELAAAEPRRKVEVVIQDHMQAHIDATLARILLENLIANAWKFTYQAAQARVEIGATQIDGANVFFVKDNGVGFDEGDADKLFKPFQRLHTVTQFPGTGIGLATAQRIIDRHGGRIWAESKTGEGATFYFTLP